jgi:hypothetical protein
MTVPADLVDDAAELADVIKRPVDLIELGQQIFVVLREVPLPAGAYKVERSDALFIADRQYRCSALDMFWTEIQVVRADGTVPDNAEQIEQYVERSWRRFSWHRNGVWNPSRNGLIDHYEFMQDRFAKDVA